MNIFYPPYQGYVFLLMSVVGFVLGIVYDAFKIKRKIFGSFFIFLFLDDFLFMSISALVFIFSVFAFNNGILRCYEVFFCILGFMVYRMTLSKMIMLFFEFVINLGRKIILTCLKILFLPIKHIFRLIRPLFEPLEYGYICNLQKSSVIKWINKLSPAGK